MLARVWRKGNAHALLMRTYIVVATMENSMEDAQKIKTEHNPAIHPCIYLKKKKNTCLKINMYPIHSL